MTTLLRPLVLEERWQYLLRVPPNAGPDPVYLPVRFIGYQPCPALILVKLLHGDRPVCKVPRGDLFIEAIDLRSPSTVSLRLAPAKSLPILSDNLGQPARIRLASGWQMISRFLQNENWQPLVFMDCDKICATISY